MKKFLSLILLVVLIVGVYNFFNQQNSFLMTTGTDEERIADTLSKYSESFNNGDFDSLIKCHNKRMQSSLKAQMKLGSSVLSGFTSFFSSGLLDLGNGGLESIWTIGTDLCKFRLEIMNINFVSENQAEVKLKYVEIDNNNRTTQMFLLMEKENEAWAVAGDFYQDSKYN